jgi:hypothetical protein
VIFDFLTDTGNAAARALGIENPNGTPMGMQMFGYENDTVRPTVIITDRHCQVVWTHETDNYRIRPEPEVYFDVPLPTPDRRACRMKTDSFIQELSLYYPVRNCMPTRLIHDRKP